MKYSTKSFQFSIFMLLVLMFSSFCCGEKQTNDEEESPKSQIEWIPHTIESSKLEPRFWILETGDLDDDGDVDILGVGENSDGSTLMVWWENSDEATSWDSHVIDEGSDGITPTTIDIGDMDGDGDLDILQALGEQTTVRWLENINGDGSSWKESLILSPDTISLNNVDSAVATDMNGDGKTDVFVLSLSHSSGSYSWWEKQDDSDTPWVQHIIADTGHEGYPVPVDIDGDGDLDVFKPNTVCGYFSNDDDKGLTWEHVDVEAELNPGDALWTSGNILLFDGDNDSDMELLLPSSASIDIWNQDTSQTNGLWKKSQLPGLTNAQHMETGIVDDDQYADILIAQKTKDKSALYMIYNVFQQAVPVEPGDLEGVTDDRSMYVTIDDNMESINSMKLADLDGDGDLDILVASFLSDNGPAVFSWFENSQTLED